MSDTANQGQLEIAGRLQDLWLKHMEMLLTTGAATSTDLATLARVLSQNGWSLDPKKLPQGLRDKMTSMPTPEELEADGILPIRSKKKA